ncbi:MAG TPA: ATP-binding protein, partial [Puia sp.]|nr:ATP-binding protein [Puia sp.]
GIEESDLDKIFDAFSRLNAKSEFDGSGIGLTICRKIVNIHKGEIHATSIPGQGSAFIFDLPAL